MEVGKDVELTGIYFGDSYAETEPHNIAIGWRGLKIGEIIQGRAAPYKIVRAGVPIGWAPPSSVKSITAQNIQKVDYEEFISVNFVSMGIQDINNYSIVCKQSWPFSELKKKLCEDYPQYNQSGIIFMTNAQMIDENKTLRENNIKKNSVISIFNNN